MYKSKSLHNFNFKSYCGKQGCRVGKQDYGVGKKDCGVRKHSCGVNVKSIFWI